MKLVKYFRIPVRAAGLVLVFCFVVFNPACKDPNDFKPDDSLVAPPAAPCLLSPPDSFVRMPGDTSNHIPLTWEAVQDAEIYEIRVDGDSIPGWTMQYDTNALNMRIDNASGFILDKFTWKVRAGSSLWEYYTDWSASRRFEIRLRPPPPQLIAPPPNAALAYDTLPLSVVFKWQTIQDERFYNLSVFSDSFQYIDEMKVNGNSFVFIAEEPGTYYWQVRAGSPYWEYGTPWTTPRKFLVIKLP